MWFWRKFVSASIVLAVLSVPLIALANCASESAASMQCPPDCVMMESMNSGHHDTEMESELSGSCCTIKSSRPAPVTEPKTVAPIVSVEPLVVSVPLTAAAGPRAAAAVDSSPPLALNSQARLCTFQI